MYNANNVYVWPQISLDAKNYYQINFVYVIRVHLTMQLALVFQHTCIYGNYTYNVTVYS